MVTVNDLRQGNAWYIFVVIILSGLGLYFALILAQTITTTIQALLPPQDSPVAEAWINLAIAFAIVIIVIIVIVFIVRAVKN